MAKNTNDNYLDILYRLGSKKDKQGWVARQARVFRYPEGFPFRNPEQKSGRYFQVMTQDQGTQTIHEDQITFVRGQPEMIIKDVPFPKGFEPKKAKKKAEPKVKVTVKKAPAPQKPQIPKPAKKAQAEKPPKVDPPKAPAKKAKAAPQKAKAKVTIKKPAKAKAPKKPDPVPQPKKAKAKPKADPKPKAPKTPPTPKAKKVKSDPKPTSKKKTDWREAFLPDPKKVKLCKKTRVDFGGGSFVEFEGIPQHELDMFLDLLK